jgi:acetyl esterase/lipase
MSSEQNKALVRRFYEEIDKGNLDAMDELVAEVAISGKKLALTAMVATLMLVFGLTVGVSQAQISRLPEPVQKRLAEIGPVYQSDIRKYIPETFALFSPLLATMPKSGVTVTRDLAYGPDPKQKLDVYQPEAATGLPVLVYVHGGGLVAGD